MTSIKSKIVINFVIVITVIVLILGGLFIGTIRQYYYGSAEQALQQRAKITTAFINKYLEGHSLYDKSRYILENVSNTDFSRIEIMNTKGYILLDSYGFSSTRYASTPEVNAVLHGSAGSWIGTDPDTLERILALSRPLQQKGQIVGAVRYTTSIEEVDRVVHTITWSAAAIGLSVILLSMIVSWLMARRIVSPIQELTLIAKQMAKGHFQHKAIIHHQDEIGHLASTLNYMAEEMLRSDKLKNDFISSISHELRTPLTSIKGWSETLVAGHILDEEETKTGLSVIAKETDRLVGLVEDLLDFSKLHDGSLHISRERVDVNRLLQELAAQFVMISAQKTILFEVSISKDPMFVLGDPNRLKQILINLLDNAMKFTSAGNRVWLAAEQSERGIIITVRDTGEGIDPEQLKYVTDKFYKGKSSRSGSGLGLSISKEIVELHGGTMIINSTIGEGTSVAIHIPKMSGAY